MGLCVRGAVPSRAFNTWLPFWSSDTLQPSAVATRNDRKTLRPTLHWARYGLRLDVVSPLYPELF